MTHVLGLRRFPRLTGGVMRGLWIAFILLSMPTVGAGWRALSVPQGIALLIPPGTTSAPYAQGTAVVGAPIASGTLLTESFLLVGARVGPHSLGQPVLIGTRGFTLLHWVEGAAGSCYEALRFAAPSGVVRAADPGTFPEPPPPHDRGAVLRTIRDTLANARVPVR